MTGPPFVILSTCKGGGYRYARTDPPHPRRNANDLYPLHRVLAENKLGRLLHPGEVVHHKDEDKTNDDPDNLEVLENAGHARQHAIERAPDYWKFECPICGKPFELRPNVARRRTSESVSGRVTCGRSCGGKLGAATKGHRVL